MLINERIDEIINADLGIERDELKQELDATFISFSSIEYHLIIHMTNTELYYCDDEQINLHENLCDVKQDTRKGIIFAFS